MPTWSAIILQALAFIVTVMSLVVQQRALTKERIRGEQRLEYKLKIFYLCQSEGLTVPEIVTRLKQQAPSSGIDEPEVNKAVYEMLTDGTLHAGHGNRLSAVATPGLAATGT
jgi:hypothetical protein